jgi:drug/metabolite transporter (DMT)-like permease
MCVGVILLLSVSWPEAAPHPAVRWGLLSGVLWGIGSLFLLRVLYSQEVSRTVPIYHTFPIYSALIAILFLGETLSFFGWLAILATVFGAITLSLRRDQEYRSIFLPRSFFLLLTGSVIAAFAYVAGKLAVDDLPVLVTHGLRNIALASVLLLGSLRSDAFREIVYLVQRKSPALIIVGFNEVVLASVANIVTIWALSLGPVSLVAALIATRSFFVVLYSTMVAVRFRGFLGEDISKGVVVVKIGATALIVAGVVGITLGRT